MILVGTIGLDNTNVNIGDHNSVKEHYEFCDTDYSEIIKFISTRWLCLEMCVNRELKKYESLKSNFLSASGAGDRFRRLKNAFRDPRLEIYLLFYQGVLPVFTTFNSIYEEKSHLFISCLRLKSVS